MWIGNDVTGRFHDQFEVLCGLEQMIQDDVLANLRCTFIGTVVNLCYHDLI
jgi:hypothetical protein